MPPSWLEMDGVGSWEQRHPYVELRLELCAGDKLTPGTGPRRAVDTVPLRMPPREPSTT